MTLYDEVVADAALERLADEHQRLFEQLVALQDHTGRKLLEAGVLQGPTERRWGAARSDLANLWQLQRAHGEVLEAARKVRARRSRPSGRDLDRLDELLRGVCAELPDGLPDAGRPVDAADLAHQFWIRHRPVAELFEAADRVWAQLGPCVDECTRMLDAGAELAERLGLGEDTGLPSQSLSALRARVDRLRQDGLSDPLSRWCPEGGGAGTPRPAALEGRPGERESGTVDRGEADDLLAACRSAHARFEELDRLRGAASQRLDQVERDVAEIDSLERAAMLTRAEVAIKIAGRPPAPPDASAVAGLRDEVVAARQLHQLGRWRELDEAVPALEDRAGATREAVARAQRALGEPLRARAELRARLELYRVKADTDGRSEDLVLERAHRQAHRLLWTAPCDLAQAATLVQDYQRLVNRPGGPGQGGEFG